MRQILREFLAGLCELILLVAMIMGIWTAACGAILLVTWLLVRFGVFL